MSHSAHSPTPDLRIVETSHLHAHEEHDNQRSSPLIERLRLEPTIINPPLVAPIGDDQFVILDGANRVHSFNALGFAHMLVQVVSYDSGQVELRSWHHVISHWQGEAFRDQLSRLRTVTSAHDFDPAASVRILFPDHPEMRVDAPSVSLHERNAILREFVAIYQQNATLNRTASADPNEVWQLYPQALAFVLFPSYHPTDIIIAAQEGAFLPPGISRHIVHGRAIRVNYPLHLLRDPKNSLSEKNKSLQIWLQHKLENRQVRYYAEATYQFDE